MPTNKPPKRRPAKRRVERSKRDWEVLRAEYVKSGLKLSQFARLKKIPESTCRKYLRSADNEVSRAELERIAEETKNSILESFGKRDGATYAGALMAHDKILGEISAHAHAAFLRSIQGTHRHPAELAKITMQALDARRQIAREIEGIPDEDSEALRWPIMRGFEPMWFQRDFCFDWPSTLARRGIQADTLAFVAGIGTGKTRCGAWKAAEAARINRGLPGAIYGPTYRMLDDATIAEFLDHLAAAGIPYTHRSSDKEIVLWGDTPVMYRTLDKPDNLRGPTIAWCWIDEALQMASQKPLNVVFGRVRHPEAKEIVKLITGTPHGFTWGHNMLVRDRAKHGVMLYNDARTEYNSYLPEGFYEGLLKLYDSLFAAQELGGEFVNLTGEQAYYNFDRKRHVLPRVKVQGLYEPDRPLVLTCDFNVSPMSWVVVQNFPHNGDTVDYVLDEIHVMSASTELAAKEFISRWGGHRGGVNVYGDASGHSKDTRGATRTDYVIIEEVLKGAKVPDVHIQAGRSYPAQSERVKDMNARLLDTHGRAHLFIADHCENLIDDLERVIFLKGTMQIDKSDETLTHMSDALGYYINREHAIRRMRYDHRRRHAAA